MKKLLYFPTVILSVLPVVAKVHPVQYNCRANDPRDTDYEVRIITPDDSTVFFKKLQPILDVLVTDAKAEMYFLDIFAANDTVYFALQDWSFGLFSGKASTNVFGAFEYGEGHEAKVFFVKQHYAENYYGVVETTEFIHRQFAQTDSFMQIHFEYFEVPEDTYIFIEDRVTRFSAKFSNNELIDERLVYRNRQIPIPKIETETVSEQTQ